MKIYRRAPLAKFFAKGLAFLRLSYTITTCRKLNFHKSPTRSIKTFITKRVRHIS